MVESAITSKDEKFNLGIQPDDIKEIKTHIISICNILFSMAAVFAACYKAAQSMVNDYGLVNTLIFVPLMTKHLFCLANINRIIWCSGDWYC